MDWSMTMAALCFVPGVAVGLTAPPGISMGVSFGTMLSGYLMSQKNFPRPLEKTGLALMLVSLGILSGLRGLSAGDGWQWAAAMGKAEGLRSLIDAIPFAREYTPALLKAFLTGDKSQLSPEVAEIFRSSGASHLLALSGLHMGIIYLMLSKLLVPLGGQPALRKGGSVCIMLLTAFFTLMTGATPSCVRAFLFIAIRETATLLHRKISLLHCLCLALFLQLTVSPQELLQAGFQLSYLAVLGICLIFPLLHEIYPVHGGHDPFARMWDMAALSISCQAFTAPLSWRLFHSFPQYFILTNLLAMPLMTVLMCCAAFTVAMYGSGWCPHIAIQATDMLCGLLVNILEIISGL